MDIAKHMKVLGNLDREMLDVFLVTAAQKELLVHNLQAFKAT